MISWLPMGFEEAFKITVETIEPLGRERLLLGDATGRIVAEDLISGINSPSIDASLKDGYALVAADVASANDETPVTLNLAREAAAAGDGTSHCVVRGEAMRILTGAKIPDGADAVVAEEFVTVSGTATLEIRKRAEPGRNILPKGTDVATGQCIAKQGNAITPGLAGIIAASGFNEIPVFKQPRVAIVATGDEVVAPGKPLPQGKLYASNMVTLSAFCRKWGMETRLFMAKDHRQEIRDVLEQAWETSDAILTSGGAWTGDRDLVAEILCDMGWKKAFHRIRIGPGKGSGGSVCWTNHTPVFILPGGPPSQSHGFFADCLSRTSSLGRVCTTGIAGN